MKMLAKKIKPSLIAFLIFVFSLSISSPALADKGISVRTGVSSGENLFYGYSLDSVNGNFLKFQNTAGIDKFKIDLTGGFYASGTSSLDGDLCWKGVCKTDWSQVGGTSQWTTSGSNIYYNTGNVGIGANAPQTGLHIKGAGVIGALTVDRTDGQSNLQLANSGTVVDGSSLGFIRFGKTYNDGNINIQGINRTSGNHDLILQPTAGYVGIGTVSPTDQLTVYGNGNGGTANIRTQSSTNAAGNYSGILVRNSAGRAAYLTTAEASAGSGYYYHAGDATLAATSNAKLHLRAGGSDTGGITIGTDGNVGVGTDSPSQKLHVFSGDAGNVSLRSGGATVGILESSGHTTLSVQGPDGFSPAIYFGSPTYPNTAFVQAYSSVTANLQFGVNNSTVMTLLQGGNVGIGTPSPSQKLHVLGTAGDVSSDFANGGLIQIDGGAISSVNYGVGINFVRTGSQMGFIKAARENAANEASYLAFASQTSGGTHPERMRIDSSGNVGIGTASPSQKLHVNGAIFASGDRGTVSGTGVYISDSAAAGGEIMALANGGGARNLSLYGQNLIFNSGTSYGEKMRIDSSGNIGIGTTGPGERLSVYGPAGGAGGGNISLYTSMTGSFQKIFRVSNTGSSVNDGMLQLYDNGTAKVNIGANSSRAGATYFNAGGNFGIGTDAPTNNRLEIYDTPIASLKNVLGVFNSMPGTSAAGNGAAIIMGHDSGSYFAKIATVFETNNPDFLRPGLAFYTMNTSYLPGSETERMRIRADGRVGIGTSNPNYKLSVDNGAATTMSVESSGSGEGGYANILLNNSSSGSGNAQIFKYANGATNWGGSNSLNIYNSNGSINFHPNNTANAMVIDNNGNVGIKNSSPGTYNLKVGGASGQGLIWVGNNNGYILKTCDTCQVGGIVSVNNLDVDGVNGGSAGILRVLSGGSTGFRADGSGMVDIAASGRITFGDGIADNKISFYSNGNHTIGLESGGMVLRTDNHISLRDSVGNSLLYVGANKNISVNYDGGAGYNFYVNGSAYSTGGWSGSDLRWKKDITPLKNSLSNVLKLNGVNYFWNTQDYPNKGFDNKKQVGLIAQEVEKVIPELVNTDNEGYKAVSYEKLGAVLVEAVKELKAENESLKARLEKLEKTAQ